MGQFNFYCLKFFPKSILSSIFFRIYTECKEQVSALNVKYLEMFQRLYKESQTTLTLALKCGNMLSSKCTRPVNVNVTVNFWNFVCVQKCYFLGDLK